MRPICLWGVFYEAKMAFQFFFLTPAFYKDYAHCVEIEQKPTRPHIRVIVRAEGIDFAVPFRSHINHPHALLTDKANKSGLDFSKAIVITDYARYVDTQSSPHIRPNEFNALRGKEFLAEQGMLRYLKQYRKALANPTVPRNSTLLKYSTLQYFSEYIQFK